VVWRAQSAVALELSLPEQGSRERPRLGTVMDDTDSSLRQLVALGAMILLGL
jgi:hypothetical protein